MTSEERGGRGEKQCQGLPSPQPGLDLEQKVPCLCRWVTLGDLAGLQALQEA